DLDLGEVGVGGAEHLHAPAGVEREIRGIGRPQQPEAQPVGVVRAVPTLGTEETLGRRVGADDEGHVAQPGQDAIAGDVDGRGTRGARRVGARDLGALPAQGLGKGGARDISGIAVAHGVGAGYELDVSPRQPGVGQRLLGRDQAVLHEVLAPLAPRVHAHPEDGNLTNGHQETTFHFHTTWSPSSSANRVDRTTSTSAPTRSESAEPSTWPSTTSFSSASSTASTEYGSNASGLM